MYMWRRLFCLQPRSMHRGGTTERKLPLHGPRPGPPPRNFQKNSRPPAGNSLDRNPPGLHPGKKNAPAFGRGRLVVSEYAGKIDFCMGK